MVHVVVKVTLSEEVGIIGLQHCVYTYIILN